MDNYPLAYRITFLWIEPLLAFGGCLQALLDPRQLLHLSLPGVTYVPSMYPIMMGMAGSWLVLVYQKTVTLRKFTDVQVWRDITIAHCLSDVMYLIACIYDIGIVRFLNPLQWTMGDWITNPTTVIPFVAKLLFLAGVGLSSSSTGSTRLSLPNDGVGEAQ